LSRNELVVLRRPRAVRPWQHVLEPLRGYLMLAARLCEDPSRFADGWNFGPDSQAIVPVADFADRMISQWGSGRCVIQEDPQGLHEATLLALDCSKARQVLGWRPLLSLEETVAMTADWYRDFYRAPGCAPRLLERQIESYEQRIDAQQLATSGAAA
jgi:CDP-glucose 4,6-dehydratase